MKVVVVSLPSATERRMLIEQEFHRLDLPFRFYDAIDGSTLSDEQISLVDASAMRETAQDFPPPGSIANWLTQMSVLQMFAYGDDDLLAVFEDDARLEKETKQILETLSEDMHGFDIVKLSWRQRKAKFHKCVQLLPSFSIGIIKGYDRGSDGYVISRKAARHLVESFPKMKWRMDHLISRYWENGLVVGIVNPPVVIENVVLNSQISDDNYGRSPKTGIAKKETKPPFLRRQYAKYSKSVRMRLAYRKITSMY